MDTTTEMPFATNDRRWEALTKRDRRAEGAFLYGVATTGVYCRPTCASRLPNRENVRFFDSHAEAERAGYRACKRCRPNLSSGGDRHADAIRRACALMEQADPPATLDDLAAAAGLSPFHFHRVFKKIVGVTPKQYAGAARMRRLQGGLEQGESVTRAIYDAGFGSSSRVYERAAERLGMTPSRYRNGAAGLRIRFAVAPVSLGWMLVAATERGICAIELGDTPEALVERLHVRFPRAERCDDDSAFAAWVRQATAFLEAPRRGLDLPLDIQGTAFQQRVWKALQEIRPGRTESYADVARRIECPSAARAVAQACASNPVAVAIPCHRVVRSDGDLGGYRWGTERKRALLEREADLSCGTQDERSTEGVG
jgi:AraC family transcriptional regulator, regulatory protein of adaptative response / methylated-DNA-[protein]-cysteine methyltransferase